MYLWIWLLNDLILYIHGSLYNMYVKVEMVSYR